ncbi:unnamed protein product (macronuclear) [Paramecium tetraurelia]|uniref:Transmembrane protein n=1 Tax=Paramecium tetraurelia TaxID=5888 RepID=A0DFU4_PARTE|nr:uncharacterized protein GSPATT00016724001 [Paramecium tetraurelia]CAK81911.1 unnamed protein product [Paramecium tetraurelia]|eukprot:XP_001449308.1 hypothetical protein (macronuclear) [Paramecium tetraurelia strain d4-2]
MKKGFYFLRKIDTFGIKFTPAINNKMNFSYKTILGGIFSLIIYSLSAAYFVYEMYRWMNMDMVPIVTTEIHSFNNDIENLLDESNAQIEFEIFNTANGNESINPFNQTQLVLTPILKNYSNGKEQAVGYNFSQYVSENIFSPQFRLNSKSEYQISFARCNQEMLLEGQICAGQDIMNNFFNQRGNELQINVILKIVDPRTFTEKQIKKTYGIILEEIECQITKISMEYTHYQIFKDFIFPTPINKIFVSETVEQTTYGTKDYCSKRFVEESYALLWITTSQVAYVQRMQYPEIGDILANIGSIIEVLFLIEFIIHKFNESCLINFMQEQILSFYYPELQQIQLKKNWFGNIKSCSLRSQVIDPKSFIKFKNKITSSLNCKFCYLNLIYEISRMQFILQSIMIKEDFYQSHQIGIKLNLKKDYENDALFHLQADDEEEFLDSTKIQNNKKLTYKDSLLLSINSRKIYMEEDYIDQELFSDRNFFDINRISRTKI